MMILKHDKQQYKMHCMYTFYSTKNMTYRNFPFKKHELLSYDRRQYKKTI